MSEEEAYTYALYLCKNCYNEFEHPIEIKNTFCSRCSSFESSIQITEDM